MSSGGGQAAAVNTGKDAPFNVTGIQPNTAVAAAGGQAATLNIGNAKRVWGSSAPEEVKAPDQTTTPSSSSFNTSQSSAGGFNRPATSSQPAAKPAPVESKADKKKAKAAAALFGGISG